MELKTFKAGIEALSRMTNQREKDPSPFMLQVSRDDGRLSLIAGGPRGVLIWRLDSYYKGDLAINREGIQSRLIVQAAKALRGKDTIHFKIHKDAFEVFTSPGQGSIMCNFVTQPDLLRPLQGEPEAIVKIPDMGVLTESVVAATSFFYDVAQFVPAGDRVRFMATDRYKMYQTYLKLESGSLSEMVGSQAGFWNALRGATNNGDARFYKSGIKVRFGDFEAYSNYSMPWTDHDYVDHAFPQGIIPTMAIELNRKTLLVLLKGNKATVEFDKPTATASTATLRLGETTVDLNTLRSVGAGSFMVDPAYLYDILGAMTDDNITLAITDNPQFPIGIKGSDPASRFLISPRVRRDNG